MINESGFDPADYESVHLGILSCERERLWELVLHDVANGTGTKAHGSLALSNAHVSGLSRDDGGLAFGVHGLREFHGFLDKCLHDL